MGDSAVVPRFGFRHWIHRPSVILFFVGCVLSVISLLGEPHRGYWFPQHIAAYTTIIWGTMMPVLTATVVWEVSRFRAVVRRSFSTLTKVALSRVLPFVFATALLYPLCVLIRGGEPVVLVSRYVVEFTAYTGFLALCWAMIGIFLGVALPAAAGIALGGGFAFFWHAYSVALEPGVFRGMTSDFAGCCGPTSVPATQGFVVGGLASLGCLGLIGAVCLALSRRQVRILGVIIPSVAALVASATLGQRLPPFNSVALTEHDATCRGTVCAMPNTPEYMYETNQWLLDTFQRLSPPDLQGIAERPMNPQGTWDDRNVDALPFFYGSDEDRDYALGRFVDLAVLADMQAKGQALCTQEELAERGVSDSLPWVSLTNRKWSDTRPVDVDRVRAELHAHNCTWAGS